jgi:hypothetical protein
MRLATQIRLNKIAKWHVPVALCALLAGCGGGDEPAIPVAQDVVARVAAVEDVRYTGQLVAIYSGSKPLRFVVTTGPRHGVLTVDEQTGSFNYMPEPDYFGDDEFEFQALAGNRSSGPAVFRMNVEPVDDLPVLDMLGNLASLPETWAVPFVASAKDADREVLQFSATSDDSAVATVEMESATGTALIYPRDEGEARITVTVTDGHSEVRREFMFNSTPVRSQRSLQVADPAFGALGIVNTADVPVSFKLRINDRIFVADRETMLTEALAQPSGIRRDDDVARLWAYVNRQTMHFSSLTAALWAHDPAVLVNSIGFGMCDDRTMALAYLVQMLDIPVRVWDVEGHVIPEVFVNDRWEVWDPDYGVVYFDEQGNVMSLANLQLRPDLITHPVDPVRPSLADQAYGEVLADLYASASNNRLVNYYYLHSVAEQTFKISLPAGGRLTIGGQHGATPATYLGVPATDFASAVLELPAGSTGGFITGLVPTSVIGAGKVRVGVSAVLDIGSVDMDLALGYATTFPGDVEITESQEPIAVSYLVNPLGARLQGTNSIVAEGLNAGALRFETRALSPSREMSLYFAN